MKMRKFIIPVLLFCASSLLAVSAEPEVDLLLRAVKPNTIKLENASSTQLNAFTPGWFKPEVRPTVLAVRSKKPLAADWQEFSFSFLPSQDGRISISLGGKDIRVRKGEKKPQIYTIYDDFRIIGAKLVNPDFDELDDHGNFTGWKSNFGSVPFGTDRGESARVWAGGRLSQEFAVTGGQAVTVTFAAKADLQAPAASPVKAENAAAIATPPQRSPKLPAETTEGVWPANWTPLDEKIDYAIALHIGKDAMPDSSAVLQARLDKGERDIVLPTGTTRVTRLVLPADTVLRGEPGAILLLDTPGNPRQPIIELAGDHISFRQLSLRIHPRTLLENLTGKRFALIKGYGIRDFRMSEINYENTDEHYHLLRTAPEAIVESATNLLARIKLYRWPLVELVDCSDIEISDCYFRNFCSVVQATQCRRVSFHDNIGINGLHNAMRFYNGSEYFLFYNNHFSHVKHPMVWDGGDCSPRTPLKPSGIEAAMTVDRRMKIGAPDYASHMAGAYEVLCYGNYGEYGKTLAWGRKGRRVIVTGNSARYTYDLAFDAEGCEEVIFSNNLAVNSKAGAFGVFYYNNGTSITGNVVVTENKGNPIYQGQFARIHAAYGVNSKRTVISGNLFISNMPEPRFIRVDKCKDLLISGNSFINGGVKTNRYSVGGSLTILGNSFVNRLENAETLVLVERGVAGFTFSHNNLVNHAHAAAPALELNLGPVKEEERAGEKVYRQLDGNTFRGWQIPVRVSENAQKNMPTVFFNNLYEGNITFPEWLKNLKNVNNLQLN